MAPLTPKAFDTLRLLVENSGCVVSKERLLAAVWPESFVEENVLAVNISTLRRVLGAQANGQPYIENIPKRGYRFAAHVQAMDRAHGVASRGSTVNHSSERAPAFDSLAVLPLVNASADPNAEYLSDGITESIINSLAQYRHANEQVGGSPPILAGMGHVYAKLGQVERAQQVITELHQLAAQRYVSPYYIATIYAGLGEQAQAFDWLHRACDNQSEGLVWVALDPMLDSLRAAPQFADILRRVQL